MLDHHIQRSLVYKLALSSGLRFSELKPEGIENKLFDYHLKKVMNEGLVEKTSEGLYQLTHKGRRTGSRILDKTEAIVDRAYSVLFLVIRRKKDASWLLYTRKTHPLKDRVGFMHAAPNATEFSTQTATKDCQQKTGLECEFSVQGSGYFRVYEGDELESFTNFTLLVCEDAQGELAAQDSHAEYKWVKDPDFSDGSMLPNMQILSELYLKGESFFVEETLHI